MKYLWILLLAGTSLYADEPMGGAPPLISQMAILAGLALLPFAVMLLTSFVKIVIVLSLLRNAIGVQQSPPTKSSTGSLCL